MSARRNAKQEYEEKNSIKNFMDAGKSKNKKTKCLKGKKKKGFR